jgi:hypothetical protein
MEQFREQQFSYMVGNKRGDFGEYVSAESRGSCHKKRHNGNSDCVLGRATGVKTALKEFRQTGIFEKIGGII